MSPARQPIAPQRISPELLAGCRRGEARAWDTFFALFAPRIYRWSVLRGLRPTEAEDATQEVLAIAHRKIERCAAPEAVHSWLYQITRRVTANHRRLAWWRRVKVSDQPVEPAFDRAIGPSREDELSARTCLARLPAKQAEVLVLLTVEGYTRAEVARMLRISPGTVASRLRLARATFKRYWAETGRTTGQPQEVRP